jgi:hypothetical protein
MTMLQDIDACFDNAFFASTGWHPAPDKKISDYNVPSPQLIRILSQTSSCLASKHWSYTPIGPFDTSKTVQAVLQSIYNSTKPMPLAALPVRERVARGFIGKKRVVKKKAAKATGKKSTTKKKMAKTKSTRKKNRS